VASGRSGAPQLGLACLAAPVGSGRVGGPMRLLAGMRARPRGSTPLSSGLARAPFDPSVGDSVAAAARLVFRVWVARSSAPAPLFVFPARRRATAGGGDRRHKYHLDPAGPFLQ